MGPLTCGSVRGVSRSAELEKRLTLDGALSLDGALLTGDGCRVSSSLPPATVSSMLSCRGTLPLRGLRGTAGATAAVVDAETTEEGSVSGRGGKMYISPNTGAHRV